MKIRNLVMVGIGLGVVGIVVYRMAAPGEARPESIEAIQEREGVPVRAETIEHETFERWATFTGAVEGKTQAAIYSHVPARVRSVARRQGDEVRAGASLITLDPLSAQQSFSALAQARIRVEDARRMYERMKPLYEAGAISREEFDQAKSAFDAAQAGLTDASHSMNLTTPIAGTVTDMRVTEGDRVEPGATLALVADLSGRKVVLDVAQGDVVDLEEGQIARIEPAGAPDKIAEGVVERISLSADPNTRLFRVEVKVEAAPFLRPGTLARVRVRTLHRDEALSVPIEAVTREDDGASVFVVTADNKAERKTVTTGAGNGKRWLVTQGLAAGDRVVSFGQNRLSDGRLVRIVDDAKFAGDAPAPAETAAPADSAGEGTD
ncbi:efflux RND transporter periplasmic adaptor subunit [bacterium]|nr:efflux RND transporter periplasmic adaptor subunit [bacterium]